MGTRFIPSEYRVVWDALTHYESYLESRASGADGQDERLKFDELLQDVDGAKKSLAAGAQNDFQLKLGIVAPYAREKLDIVTPRKSADPTS